MSRRHHPVLQSGDLEALTDLRERERDFAPGHLFHGIRLLDEGRIREALDAFDMALVIQPSNDLAASYRGLALIQAGRCADARDQFARTGFSDNREFMVRLVIAVETRWVETGEFLGPRNREPHDAAPPSSWLARWRAERTAVRAFLKRDWATLVKVLDPWVAAPDATDDLLLAVATGCEMIRDYDTAFALLGRLSARASDTDFARAAKGRLQLRLGDPAGAAANLESVLIVGPEDFAVNYYLGILCLASGEQTRAREMFTRAFTDYFIDTFEYQFWQVQQAILDAPASAEPATATL